MNDNGTYKIRPAGRHILTIGRDLIQDPYAAVVELVKNAYDADSPDVTIEFRAASNHVHDTIVVSDNGHGMSRDTVINKWMVPSTPDKHTRRNSPAGRVMQGRKGVGRYVTSILGTDLLLETVTAAGEKTTVYVEWKNFEDAQYLDDVEVLIETSECSAPSGTRLTMKGDDEFLAQWNEKQFDKLHFELKKLISPVSTDISADDFRINLIIDGFPTVDNRNETIKPYPLIDIYDYKIAGTISAEGKGTLTYSMQKVRNAIDEEIPFDTKGSTGCGELVLDIRVYDREKEAIDSLIRRGFTDESGSYVGKSQARQLLNHYNGIGVYRNGFRIRPLGDADFDWLLLNKRRVQNPSLRIGSNQAIGYVQIQSDEQSELIEKSARDGLKENAAFDRLKEITTEVIAKLETRRFEYRSKAGLSRSARKVEDQLDLLFSFDELKRNIHTQLTKDGVNQATSAEIMEMIKREEEDTNKVVEEIRQAVAIYQGQATLGKIMNVVLHEGRRPLGYFRNQIPNLHYWYELYKNSGDPTKLADCLPIVNGINKNANVFVELFRRLDPLAARKRSAQKPLVLKNEITDALAIFKKTMKSQQVCLEVAGSNDFRFSCWSQDIHAIFVNLVDNSLYWMNGTERARQRITIELVTADDALLHIDYRDNGPGIEPDLIASQVIFEPQFSTKPDGTGLGLAIAGEAATRNGLELQAFECEQGAWFRLQPTENAQ